MNSTQRLASLPFEGAALARAALAAAGWQLAELPLARAVAPHRFTDVICTLARNAEPGVPDVLAHLTRYERLAPRPPLPFPPLPRYDTNHPDSRRVVRVVPNPRLPTTPAYQRYRMIRKGLTVRQLLSRGVHRRELRELARAGHLEFSA